MNAARPSNPDADRFAIELVIRTPSGVLYQGRVAGIRAEDLDGWYGIKPRRPDLISVLVPGLLVFEDAQGEAYVANAGGVLDLRAGVCRVALSSAVLTRATQDVERTLAEQRATLERRKRAQRETIDVLIDEALRRATHPESNTWTRR